MAINCPLINTMIKVTNGFMCAKGTKSAGCSAVFAKVYSGYLTPPPPDLGDIMIATSGTSATIIGSNWTAQNVPVPPLGSAGNSPPGAPLTLIAWELANYPGSNPSILSTSFVNFFGVIPTVFGAIDCCTGSSSGSSAPPPSAEVFELTREADLLVSIVDGPNTGNHVAKWSSHLRWQVQVGKETLDIHAESNGYFLELHGDHVVRSSSIQHSPFLALFPGKVLGSSTELVVVQS
jgi:hypothetical protein